MKVSLSCLDFFRKCYFLLCSFKYSQLIKVKCINISCQIKEIGCGLWQSPTGSLCGSPLGSLKRPLHHNMKLEVNLYKWKGSLLCLLMHLQELLAFHSDFISFKPSFLFTQKPIHVCLVKYLTSVYYPHHSINWIFCLRKRISGEENNVTTDQTCFYVAQSSLSSHNNSLY